MELVHEFGSRLRAQDARHHGVELGTVERFEVDARDPPAALELGQEGPQRVPTVQLVRTVRHRHEHGFAHDVADEEREEIARGLIGPVEIFDGEHDRRSPRQTLQHAEEKLEQAMGRHRFVAIDPERRDEASKTGGGGPDDLREGRLVETIGEWSQPLDDGAERQRPLAEIHAATGQNEGTGTTGPIQQLTEKPGLANAGFAPDDDTGGHATADLGEARLDDGQLVGTADEGGARDASNHVVDLATTLSGGGRRNQSA